MSVITYIHTYIHTLKTKEDGTVAYGTNGRGEKCLHNIWSKTQKKLKYCTTKT